MCSSHFLNIVIIFILEYRERFCIEMLRNHPRGHEMGTECHTVPPSGLFKSNGKFWTVGLGHRKSSHQQKSCNPIGSFREYFLVYFLSYCACELLDLINDKIGQLVINLIIIKLVYITYYLYTLIISLF